MTSQQACGNARYQLHSERLGPLPIVNAFVQRLGLGELLEQFVPTTDRRRAISHAQALGVLLRSLIVEREPVYRQQETVHEFGAGLFGISAEQMTRLTDDRLGRSLDQLFDADRAALLTTVVLAVGQRFNVSFAQLHNDSTSVAFCGQYRAATGRKLRGHSAPAIVHGFSKDHRPDLKQLLFILSVTAEGVPASFRCADGNTADSVTHIETWEALCKVAGRTDFLYVADAKLCTQDNMRHIDRAGGRFVTVMPRNRQEDGQFRKWLQSHTPEWIAVWDRPNPRYRDGPRDRWFVYQPAVPSIEAWPVTWVWSSLLTLRQGARRQRCLAAATEELQALRARLAQARARLRGAREIDRRVEDILERHRVARYFKVNRIVHQQESFKQTRRGRPGPDTAYRKVIKRRFDLQWTLDRTAIAYDEKSDGMYPLLCNDRELSPAKILEAHKGQPTIETRFEQLKTVHEIAPTYLKNEGRIEALFTLYFLALLLQALIERELRRAMAQHGLTDLPIYPEARDCRRPTTEQILRLFSMAARHRLLDDAKTVQIFDVDLTNLQRQVLDLLGVSVSAYRLTT